MFDELESRKPNHFAVRQYKKYKLAAGKTAKSILISCGARLAVFDIAELREVTSYDELELDTLGDRKTALFLIMSDTDDSFNFLISMCYTQLFNLLCEKADDDKVMKLIPDGKVITVGKIREYFAELNGADFTEPITAGIFVSIAAWASYQRSEDETPYWRTLKANGELNEKYPGGVKAQKEKLEAEGHTIIQKGRTNIKYFVKDYESVLFDLR